MADVQQEVTTAQALSQFKKELAEAGMEPDTVTYLVQSAGRELLVGQGLRIKEVSRDG
ncbi:hypothetical protein [Streptomyces sp. NPDC002666]